MKLTIERYLSNILLGIASLAIVASAIIVMPSVIKAATITVTCDVGSELTCEGTGCKCADNSGCECISLNGSSVKKTCPTEGIEPEVPTVD